MEDYVKGRSGEGKLTRDTEARKAKAREDNLYMNLDDGHAAKNQPEGEQRLSDQRNFDPSNPASRSDVFTGPENHYEDRYGTDAETADLTTEDGAASQIDHEHSARHASNDRSSDEEDDSSDEGEEEPIDDQPGYQAQDYSRGRLRQPKHLNSTPAKPYPSAISEDPFEGQAAVASRGTMDPGKPNSAAPKDAHNYANRSHGIGGLHGDRGSTQNWPQPSVRGESRSLRGSGNVSEQVIRSRTAHNGMIDQHKPIIGVSKHLGNQNTRFESQQNTAVASNLKPKQQARSGPLPPPSPKHRPARPATNNSAAGKTGQVRQGDHVETPRHDNLRERNDLSVDQNFDYRPEQLMRLDFDTIKAAVFDFDPASKPAERSQEELYRLLGQQFNAGQAQQVEFMSTMTIDEWEDAGEWLLKHATDIMSRMRQARREKRRMALKFEDEIAERYEHVKQKRQATEDALAAIRTSGGKVLESTPRKARHG